MLRSDVKSQNMESRSRSRLAGILIATACFTCLALSACVTTDISSKPTANDSSSQLPAVKPPPTEATVIASSKFATAAQVAPSTVAVADFEGGSVPPEKSTEFWGKALASFMIADMGASKNLRLIDRDHLADVLHEQMISATDLADPRTRVRVGKILGAKYFIFGTYTIAGGQAALTARMDLVETGEIMQADSISGNESDMPELAQQLAGKFLSPLDRLVAERELHPTLSTAGPPAAAVHYFSQGIEQERAGNYDRAIDMFTRALAIYPQYPDAHAELEKTSELAARQP
jgi:TolB-like protein